MAYGVQDYCWTSPILLASDLALALFFPLRQDLGGHFIISLFHYFIQFHRDIFLPAMAAF